ncbi:MAG: Fic family protein [Clostridiales Family XIII bacterium]|jgi:hypothetical protein|nr:Fic family protein [Clostridiales Family XIII bacterium]
MFAETEKKRARLNEGKPLLQRTKDYADRLALFDLAYTTLKLDGSKLTAEGVNHIMEGRIVSGVSVGEHIEIDRHRLLLRAFSDMLHMDTALDRKELSRLYGILTDNPEPAFRTEDPVLHHLGYAPPPYADVPDRLDQLFRNLFLRDYGGDCVRRAAELHAGVIAVYPFAERTEALARIALQYELLRGGFPVISFGLSEQDYNRMVSEGIRSGVHDALYEHVLSCVDRKLDLLLSL